MLDSYLGIENTEDEPNDTLSQAMTTGLSSEQPGKMNFSGSIDVQSDVDIYQVSLEQGDWLQLRTSTHHRWWYTPIVYEEGNENRPIQSIDSQPVPIELRIFDAEGNELSTTGDLEEKRSYNLDWVAEETGIYYIGVSGANNLTYDATVADSGTEGETGNYNLAINLTPPPDAENPTNDTIETATEINSNQNNSYPWRNNNFWHEDTLGDNPNVNPELDVDFYSLTVEAGKWVNLYTNTATLTVFDADGNKLYSGEDQGGFLTTADEDYYIAISSLGNESFDPNVEGSGSNGSLIGDYYLSGWIENALETNDGDNDTIATAIPLVDIENYYYHDDYATREYFFASGIIGDNPNVPSALDVDFYSVEVEAGQWVNINAWNTTSRVFDDTGNEITVGENQTGFLATVDGTYYIGMSSLGNDSYNPNTAGSGDAGTTLGNYSLNVTLQEGLEETGSTNDTLETAIPALTLQGDDEDRYIDYLPEGDAIYYEDEWGWRNNDYYSTQGIIGDNPDVASGVDVDFYSIELETDKWVELSAWKTHLKVFDEAGNELFTGEDQLEFLALDDQTYYIGVSGLENENYNPNVEGSGDVATSIGEYYLSIHTQTTQEDVGDTNDTIATAQKLRNRWSHRDRNGIIGDNPEIAPELDVDFYELEVEAGEWVQLSTWETTLRLFDEAGNEQFANTDHLEFIAPENTTYYLGVSSLGNDSYNPNVSGSGDSGETLGSYYLNIWREMTLEGGGETDDTIDTARELEGRDRSWWDENNDYHYFWGSGYLGDNLSVDPTLDVDFYELEVEAGDWVSLYAWEGTLRVFDEDGTEIYSANNSMEFVAEDTATYYLGISSLGNDTYDPNTEGSGDEGTSLGQYHVSISTQNTPEGTGITDDTIANATSVTFTDYNYFSSQGFIGDNISLENPELDVDFYQFDLEAGKWSSLTAWGYNLRLFDEEGNEVLAEENSIEFFTASPTTYYLGISSVGNENYNPNIVASGTEGDTTGSYYLNIQVETTPEGSGDATSDTLETAIDINSQADDLRYFETSGFIGDNPEIASGLDVDFYAIQLDAGDRLNINSPWYYWPVFTDERQGLELTDDTPFNAERKKVDSGQWIVDSQKEVDSGQWIVDSQKEEKPPTNHYPLPTNHYPLPTTHYGEGLDREMSIEQGTSDLIYPPRYDNHPLFLRLFDAEGNEIETNEGFLDFQAEVSGTYYLGVSGEGNETYNPDEAGSGSEGETSQYHLYFNIDSDPKPETPVNDIFENAIEVSLQSENRYSSQQGYIGNNPNIEAGLDVDFYAIELAEDSQLNVHSWRQTLRLFDATGEELLTQKGQFNFTATEAGTYYLGVSADENDNYNPEVEGSGTVGETGEYHISFNTWFDVEDTEIKPEPTIVWIEATDTIKSEGDSGNTPFTFEIMREGDIDTEIVLEWSLGWIEPTWNTVDENDFADGVIPSGEIIFAPNEVSQTITIEVAGDDIPEKGAEGWEQFTLFLEPVSDHVEIEIGSAQAKILDDDTSSLYLVEEPNDTIETSIDSGFSSDSVGINQFFAPTLKHHPEIESFLDVDMFAFQLDEGDQAVISVAAFSMDNMREMLTSFLQQGMYQPRETEVFLRIFDSDGNELASSTVEERSLLSRVEFVAPETGSYYLGVSSVENDAYNPLTVGSEETTTTTTEEDTSIDYSVQMMVREERTPLVRLANVMSAPQFGSRGDEADIDRMLSIDNKLHFSGKGNDVFDASTTEEYTRLYTGSGEDDIIVGTNDRLFGGLGNDRFQANLGGGGNRLYGGLGDDEFFLGSGDRLFGGSGDDEFLALDGGEDNLLFGGEGADVFWFDSENLPETVNTIADFISGEDSIVLLGSEIEFTDLQLRQDGDNTTILWNDREVVTLNQFDSNALNEADVTFM